MNLSLPTVGPVSSGGTAGPDWADNLNTALEVIDAHDHSTGKGKRIPVAGLSINADLDFQNKKLSNLQLVGIASTASSLASASNKNSIYVKDGELYWITSAGVNVQITSGTGLNQTGVGGIGGDYTTSDASVAYSDTSKTFTFKQDSSKTANITCGAVSIYENVSGGKFSKFQQATSAPTNLTYTLPSALPASVSLPLLSSTSGTLSFAQIDTAQLADSSVQTAKIGNSQVTTAKIADGAIEQAKRAPLDLQVSSSSGLFTTTSTSFTDVTNLSVTITTTGRPVFIGLVADGTTSAAYLSVEETDDASVFMNVLILEGSTIISRQFFQVTIQSGSVSADPALVIPSSSVNHIYTPAPGTYTFKVQVGVTAGSTGKVTYTKLLAYEL